MSASDDGGTFRIDNVAELGARLEPLIGGVVKAFTRHRLPDVALGLLRVRDEATRQKMPALVERVEGLIRATLDELDGSLQAAEPDVAEPPPPPGMERWGSAWELVAHLRAAVTAGQFDPTAVVDGIRKMEDRGVKIADTWNAGLYAEFFAALLPDAPIEFRNECVRRAREADRAEDEGVRA